MMWLQKRLLDYEKYSQTWRLRCLDKHYIFLTCKQVTLPHITILATLIEKEGNVKMYYQFVGSGLGLVNQSEDDDVVNKFEKIMRYFGHPVPLGARILVMKAVWKIICLFYPLLLFGEKSLYIYGNSNLGAKLITPFLFWEKLIIYIFFTFRI